MRKWILSMWVLSVALGMIFPAFLFCEDIDVFIKGVDDGVKTTQQNDYMEALMDAKLQAIQRGGVDTASISKIENIQLKNDVIESKAKEILLPGFQVMDIGYQANGAYLVILVGKVRAQSTVGSREFDNALMAIKKIENLTQTGVSYRDYVRALPEMTLAIKMYEDSPKPDTAKLETMKNVILRYQTASATWQIFIKGWPGERTVANTVWCGGGLREFCDTILRQYPKISKMEGSHLYLPEVLSAMWSAASEDIQKLKVGH